MEGCATAPRVPSPLRLSSTAEFAATHAPKRRSYTSVLQGAKKRQRLADKPYKHGPMAGAVRVQGRATDRQKVGCRRDFFMKKLFGTLLDDGVFWAFAPWSRFF